METTIVYWGYIGIMEKRMETTKEFKKHISLFIFHVHLILHYLGVMSWYNPYSKETHEDSDFRFSMRGAF